VGLEVHQLTLWPTGFIALLTQASRTLPLPGGRAVAMFGVPHDDPGRRALVCSIATRRCGQLRLQTELRREHVIVDTAGAVRARKTVT